MGMLTDGDGYGIRVKWREERIAKWRKKYAALGCTPTEIERIIRKRLWRR